MVLQVEQKLVDLNRQKLSLEASIRDNEALGQGILSLVEARANPREISKFKMHCEDLDKITSLLVCLSGRLARVESALLSSAECFDSNSRNLSQHFCGEEKASQLLCKKEKLQCQLSEAKNLQENTDKRSLIVGAFLKKYFNPSEYRDFEAFVATKAKLIMETREIGDKIELCQEQMRTLTKNL